MHQTKAYEKPGQMLRLGRLGLLLGCLTLISTPSVGELPLAPSWAALDVELALPSSTAIALAARIDATPPASLEALFEEASALQAASDREYVYLALARRLAEVEGSDAVGLLERLAAIEAEHLRVEIPCRFPVYTPVHDFHGEAERGLIRHEVRIHANALLAAARTDTENFLPVLLDRQLSRVSIADVVTLWSESLTPKERAAWLNHLAGSVEPRAQAAVMSLLIISGELPTKTQVMTLDSPSAWRLFHERGRWKNNEQQQLLELLADHPTTRLAALAELPTAADDVETILRASGVEGAALVARDSSPEQTLRIAACLGNLDIQRHAVLALMLQSTKVARSTLRENIDNETINGENLVREVRTWLGE